MMSSPTHEITVATMTNEWLRFMSPQERDALYMNNLAAATASLPANYTLRVICERGLDFIRHPDDAWYLATQDDHVSTSPYRVLDEVGLRPVYVIATNRSGGLESYLLPVCDSPRDLIGNPYCVTKDLSLTTCNLPLFMDLTYYTRNIKETFRRLVLAYAWAARETRTPLKGKTTYASLRYGATWISFAADDLLIVLIRLLDRLRFVVRDRFGIQEPLGKILKWGDLIKNLKVKDKSLTELFESAHKKTEFYRTYRNYVEHMRPIGGANAICQPFYLNQTGWGVTFDLPDPPLPNDFEAAQTGQWTDALSLCWKGVSEVLGVAGSILDASTNRQSTYPYPDEV